MDHVENSALEAENQTQKPSNEEFITFIQKICPKHMVVHWMKDEKDKEKIEQYLLSRAVTYFQFNIDTKISKGLIAYALQSLTYQYNLNSIELEEVSLE